MTNQKIIIRGPKNSRSQGPSGLASLSLKPEPESQALPVRPANINFILSFNNNMVTNDLDYPPIMGQS